MATTLNVTLEDKEAPTFEPAELLARLKSEAMEGSGGPMPPTLSIAEIRRAPALFQPRHTMEDERHIQDLVRAVKNVGVLDPITVMYIGKHLYLIDGHHRVCAYELAGVTAPVPVQYFQGTIKEAVLEAGRVNSKAKLPMTLQERQDFAWRLVLLGSYSKKETSEAAGVADGQVAIMRRAKRTLGLEAYDYTSWWKAHRRARGMDGYEMSDDERASWREARAADLAEKIAKACGPRFTRDPEIAAMALERLFGRRLGDLASCLRDFIPEEAEDNLDF